MAFLALLTENPYGVLDVMDQDTDDAPLNAELGTDALDITTDTTDVDATRDNNPLDLDLLNVPGDPFEEGVLHVEVAAHGSAGAADIIVTDKVVHAPSTTTANADIDGELMLVTIPEGSADADADAGADAAAADAVAVAGATAASAPKVAQTAAQRRKTYEDNRKARKKTDPEYAEAERKKGRAKQKRQRQAAAAKENAANGGCPGIDMPVSASTYPASAAANASLHPLAAAHALLETPALRRASTTMVRAAPASAGGRAFDDFVLGGLDWPQEDLEAALAGGLEVALRGCPSAAFGFAMTHEAMMAERPPSHDQLRQLAPVPAIVIPTTPPTIACVVETGILPNVASSRKSAAPINAASIPSWYTGMSLSQ